MTARPLALLCLPALLSPPGEAEIRGRAGPSDIVVRTTSRLAGAIDSVRWNGKEFIDSFDHGRQLQSASNFDAGAPFTPETFNPTEAGSRADGTGAESTSRLLELEADGRTLRTRTRMAFWLRPGERSAGNPARNDRALSDHVLTKRVTIGFRDLPHVMEYHVTFTVPGGETHRYAQFEAVTGYMPPEFSRFLFFDPETGTARPLDDGPGEQARPVILSTPSGSHAMGVYSPDQPSAGYEGAGYGRFRFKREKVVKWNCVFRVKDDGGIRAGDYAYRTFVAVGTLDDVVASIRRLRKILPPRAER